MNDIDDFVALVRDELGLPVTEENLGWDLDQIPGWDSVYLLFLLNVLEQGTGNRISVPDALEASSLTELYSLAVAR